MQSRTFRRGSLLLTALFIAGCGTTATLATRSGASRARRVRSYDGDDWLRAAADTTAMS
jgi:hypothetical protein